MSLPWSTDEIEAAIRARIAIVADSGCWEWTHSKKEGGYGRLLMAGRHYSAHRLAAHVWIEGFSYLDFPLQVCHRCDNPPCCNPDHLFIGTAADNARDASRKGRLKGWPGPHPSQRIHPLVKKCPVCDEEFEPRPDRRGQQKTCLRPECVRRFRSNAMRGRRTTVTQDEIDTAWAMLASGATYRQIGEHFGITASAVHNRLHRTRTAP